MNDADTKLALAARKFWSEMHFLKCVGIPNPAGKYPSIEIVVSEAGYRAMADAMAAEIRKPLRLDPPVPNRDDCPATGPEED